MMAVRPGWWDDAACSTSDGRLVSVFFPGHGEQGKVRIARRICRGCPVLAECRADAFANPELFGIRAGMTPKQRGGLSEWPTAPYRAAREAS